MCIKNRPDCLRSQFASIPIASHSFPGVSFRSIWLDTNAPSLALGRGSQKTKLRRWCVASGALVIEFVFGKMGSRSWQDDILQALLIGLVVQIVVSILWVFCAFLRASWNERMARPPTGESMADYDVEMGTVSVADEAITPDNPPQGLTVNASVGDDEFKLEDTENTTDTRASTPEIPTLHGSSTEAEHKNVPEDVWRGAAESVPVVVDASHPDRVVEELAGKEA